MQPQPGEITMKTTLVKPATRSANLVDLYASETSTTIISAGGKDQGITFNDEPGQFSFPTSPIHIGGLVFSESNLQPNNLIIWGANGSDGGVSFTTNSLYQNGGHSGMDMITRELGSLFSALALDVGNGNGLATEFVWAREFLNGREVASIDADVPATNRLSFTGSFDTLFIQEYTSVDQRNQHDPNASGAISIDNITFE
jgi:hypothetical protein